MKRNFQLKLPIEHPENKVVVQTELFENEIGPGACVLQECQGYKAKATDYISILSFLSRFLAGECLLDARLEHSKSNLVFDMRYGFIFEMLYLLRRFRSVKNG